MKLKLLKCPKGGREEGVPNRRNSEDGELEIRPKHLCFLDWNPTIAKLLGLEEVKEI